MNRCPCSRTNTSKRSHIWLDDDDCGVVFCSTAVSPFFRAGSRPVGLVTHEDTPPAPHFHTFWLYLSDIAARERRLEQD